MKSYLVPTCAWCENEATIRIGITTYTSFQSAVSICNNQKCHKTACEKVEEDLRRIREAAKILR